MIVVDSNILAARSLTCAQTCLSEQVEQIDPIWIAPALWRYEFQNILAKAVWARQITPDEAVRVWRDGFARMSDNESDPSADKVLELCSRYRITAYTPKSRPAFWRKKFAANTKRDRTNVRRLIEMEVKDIGNGEEDATGPAS